MRILVFIIIITSCLKSYCNPNSFFNNFNEERLFIGENDTVIFDFKSATVNGSKISIPILINTDEKIFSVDFSFNFNQTLLKLDTITKAVPEMEMTYFINQSDKKLRLTSFNLKEIKTDKKVFTINFTMIGNTIRQSDIFNINSFLNGDGCSTKLTPNTIVRTSSNDFNIDEHILIYPNPTSDYVNIRANQKINLVIYDSLGRLVLDRVRNENDPIDISHLEDGAYLLFISQPNGNTSYKKIIKI
jgi:hypothetical protein